MDDMITQAWLDAAHQEFNDQEKWRLAEMRAFWRQAVAAGWKDRFIQQLRAIKESDNRSTNG